MLLVGNGRVFTLDDSNPYLKDGAVVIDGEVIKEIGSFAAMKEKYPDAEFVDAHGQLILPGFINAHTHIYSGLARGLAIKGNNPTNFYEVLDGTWWKIDRHLTIDGTKACAYATILDCIRDGVTTIFDHQRFREACLPSKMWRRSSGSAPACAMRSQSATAWKSVIRAFRRMLTLLPGRRKRTAI